MGQPRAGRSTAALAGLRNARPVAAAVASPADNIVRREKTASLSGIECIAHRRIDFVRTVSLRLGCGARSLRRKGRTGDHVTLSYEGRGLCGTLWLRNHMVL